MKGVLILGLLLLVGCDSLGGRHTRLQTTEDVDWDEPALVESWPGVRLYRIDEQKFPYRDYLEVEVPAGQHEVVFGYLGNNRPQWLQSIEPVTLTFTAEHGRTYRLEATYEVPDGGGPSKHYPWTGSILDTTDPDAPVEVATARAVGLVSVTPFRW